MGHIYRENPLGQRQAVTDSISSGLGGLAPEKTQI